MLASRRVVAIGAGLFLACWLSGCTTTGAASGSMVPKVLVPPPPLGKGSSTITVVPAKSASRRSEGKRGDGQETPGGGTRTSGVCPRQQTSSYYELMSPRRGSKSAMATKTATPSGAPDEVPTTQVPVPVLYQGPSSPTRNSETPLMPKEAPSQETGERDPRLAS